ncbi:MAG: alpha/beta hydrolase [Planctomycetaceae bacterium]|nr:alpha/beta hydrolase [Planctomycetaceae bacterium]
MNRLVTLTVLLTASMASAQVPAERTPLWTGLAPTGDGKTETSRDANAFITVHRAENPNGTSIVICPGGGYGGLVTGPEGHSIAAWLNEHGITGIVLEYRLPKGRHAVPLLDAQRAIRTVRTNAQNWGLNPDRIGIMGFSAGGHLASTAATHFDNGQPAASDVIDRVSCRPDFAILVYPVVTMGETTHGGTKANLLGPDPSPELLKLYSNEKQVADSTPPIFLTHALDDKPVPPENSRALFAALQEHNIPSEYLELPSGGHGLNGYKGPMWDAWQTQSLKWLATLHANAETAWTPERQSESEFAGRKLDTYQHDVKPSWGYAAAQRDTFLVLHPEQPRTNAPLYVVLHSAGHDVHSCLECTKTVGNHDIYHAPADFFALYVDCRANKGDWWWGIEKYKGSDVSPTEKRVLDTVRWVIDNYEIDPNRVYLCGNSMGGSGTLGLGIRHGDVFAAVKANVPAGVEHVSSRMYFPPNSVPPGVTLPDPPIVIDYSAQNDGWSKGHGDFAKAMNDRKYPLVMYWGPFGHANNHADILKVNDLINSLDWLNIRKDEAYPVFTNASTNHELPWPDHTDSKQSGQINAFFRWSDVHETEDSVEIQMRLVNSEELRTAFAIPVRATADISVRRLQSMKVPPGSKWHWSFGSAGGMAQADDAGCITVPQLEVTASPAVLSIRTSK